MSEPLGPGSYSFATDDVSGERLDLAVARLTGRSRTQAATLIATGKVTIEGRSERASFRCMAGESIDLTIAVPPGREIAPEQIPLRIAF